MQAFWQQEIGLPFDHMLPLGGGLRQFRHDLLGSVLKINNGRDVQVDTGASGYRELLIAKQGLAEPRALVDPDGNRVTLCRSVIEASPASDFRLACATRQRTGVSTRARWDCLRVNRERFSAATA